MKCAVCERCRADPQSVDRCMYGGPYAGYVYGFGADALTSQEVKEAFGGAAGPIIRTAAEQSALELHMAYVAKYGHQPP